MVGPTECEECGKTIPSQPKPVKEKYGNKSLCDECKAEYKQNNPDEFDEDVIG